ncbi:AraC family transcriptional regulator [Pseudonocardia acidicola]|uniref:AraC family transcriptional regulator n=1 Tax=Pseudonocardia acidicola TaxID=2724939 RepID=A0ABX1SDY6_9PSEU|nr:AraC family transcriptional regulator [Pseudonocardia acidicola]NMH99791.1 AraC family transcriptional regulator [Pseudonocardia acidicola]
MADPQYFAFSEFDPDVAESVSREGDVVTSLDLLHRPTPEFSYDAYGISRGPLSVEEIWYTDETRVGLPADDDTGYAVSLPLQGAMQAGHRGREMEVAPGQAAAFQPVGGIDIITDSDYDFLVVRIDAGVLEDTLEDQLGHSVQRPLQLAPTMDLETAAGRVWAGLVRLVLDGAPPGGGLMDNPTIAEPLQESLLVSLLQTIDHPYREELEAPMHTWAPGPVRRTVDLIEAFPEIPFTVADLAHDEGLSVRALQQGWLRHLGVRPTHYLQRVRLGRAHLELQQYAPGETTVVGTAYQWGFPNPARFVDAYGKRYGLPPAQTLRGPAYA